MTDECRNDCLEQLLFPKPLYNRPSLSKIDYRIGNYADIRETILRKLDMDAVLATWTHREADDPGIALLEGASILGDILTFYQELYANEAFLRTAQWRDSIADLVRLLGYRLSPGLGGKATFAFEVKGNKPIVIPKGFPLKVHLEGQEKSVDFESNIEITAFPPISKFNLFRPLIFPPDRIESTTKKFYIYDPPQAEGSVSIEKKDRLLVGHLYPYQPEKPTQILDAEVVIVDEVYELHGRQYFKIKGSLKRTRPTPFLDAFKLGRSFRHFGHNAPHKYYKVTGSGDMREFDLIYFRRLGETTSEDEEVLPDGRSIVVVKPDLNFINLPLDNEIQDLSIGNQLIIEARLWGRNSSGESVYPRTFTLIRKISDIRALSLTWGSITGSTILVSLDQGLATTDGSNLYDFADIRYMNIHEVISPPLRMRAVMEETSEHRGTELNYFGSVLEIPSFCNRKLLFEKEDGSSFTRTVTGIRMANWDSLENKPSHRIILNLDKNVQYRDFTNDDPKVTVYGNLIEATQGKTEREAILGNGDNRETFQTFKIPKAPLTYFISKDETPPETPELEVYVNDIKWERVSSFFGHGPKEEIYIVREDDDGNSWVQFGDGKTGARLPSGIGNVVARYRTGAGAYGALKKGATAQPGKKLNGLHKVYLPGVVSGGSEPETGENAQEAAPGKVQSLGRLVSLKDYETEILGISGVAKAAARWQLENNIPTVVLTVLLESGRDDEETELKETIQKYNRNRGPQRFPIQVKPGRRKYVYLILTVGVDPGYHQGKLKTAIQEKLGVMGEEGNGIAAVEGLFGMKQRQFGQYEYATRIEGTVQNIKGVVWARVEALGFVIGESEDPSELTRPETMEDRSRLTCDTEALLCLHTSHFELILSEVDTTEVPVDES